MPSRLLQVFLLMQLSLVVHSQEDEIQLQIARADSRAARGSYGQALDQLEMVLDVVLEEGEAAQSLAVLERLVRINQAKGLLEECEEYLAIGNELPEAKGNRGFQLAKAEYDSYRGRYHEAEVIYRDLLAADEEDVAARIGLASVLDTQGKKNEAQIHLEWLLDLVYNRRELSAHDYNAAARACFLLDKYSQVKNRWERGMIEYAWQLFSDAQELDPQFADNLADKGYLYIGQNNFPEARKVFEKALAINSNHVEALVGLAETTLELWSLGYERYRLASEYLDRAEAVNPSHPRLLAVRAARSFDEDAYEKARELLNRSLEVNPHDLETLAILACVQMVTGDTDGFKETEGRALKSNPLGAPFYWKIATIVDRKFLYRQAVEFSRKALSLDPDFWPAMTTLGLNLMRTGDEVEGEKMIRAAFEHDKRNIYCENMLTLLKRMARDYETIQSEHFIIRLHKDQRKLCEEIVVDFLEEAYKKQTEKYHFAPKGKILFEMFAAPEDFSTRSVGVPHIGAIGVCFGTVVTEVGPNPGNSWARTLWHEFTHVITVEMTEHRVPRWLTEGISTYEESEARPEWRREYDMAILSALHSERLLPIRELNRGFTKPKWPGQIILSYYQAAMVCEFIEARYGFDKILTLLDGYRQFKTPDQIFFEAFGLTLEEFDQAFLAWVKDLYKDYTWKPPYDATDVRRFKRAVRKEPNNPQLYAELARAYLFVGKIADAETNAGKALEIDPKNGDAILVIAGLLLRNTKKELAKDLYLKALDNGTTHPFAAFVNLGNLLMEEKKLRQAAAMFREARGLFPTHAGVLAKLLEIYTELGLDDERLEVLEAIVAQNHLDIENRLELVKLYTTKYKETRGWSAAAALLEQTLTVLPIDPTLRGKYGSALLKSGNTGEVTVRELSLATEFHADGVAQFWLDLAELRLIRDEPKEAIEAAQAALDRDTIEEDRAREILKKAQSRLGQ